MQAPIRPKAIIFDYGHVLCLPQPPEDLKAMAAIFQVPPEVFDPVYWRYRVPYDQAKLDACSYWNSVAADLDRKIKDSDILRLTQTDVSSWSHIDACMMAWACKVREAGMRTAILSNMPFDLRDWIERQAPWFKDFDFATFSCDIRATKPAPEIYQHCLAGVGVSAEEALFFDDRPENVAGATKLGINAVLFTNAQDTIASLEGTYVLPAPLPC